MQDFKNKSAAAANRRSFLTRGAVVAGTAAIGSAMFADRASAFGLGEESGELSRGDAAILRLLAAVEIIETDLWQQYNELGGVQDKEVPGGSGSPAYTAALKNLDGDMDQYIHDNTDDEHSHWRFLNAYLESKGSEEVDLDIFRTLPSSQATGAQQIGRLTNLMRLNVDTTWYTRYRSTANPDVDHGTTFPPAVPGLARGQHPAIPRNDNDLTPQDHLQAIANTAGFHFCAIEQEGSTLYPSLAQRVSHPEVLRILLSIGPTETAHFQTWLDKAGNAVNGSILPAPLIDPKDPTVVFPVLTGELFQPNLIMPEPCTFLNRKFPRCSIVRPTETAGAAMAAINGLTASGLFIGQSKAFFQFVRDLAADADRSRREDR